jgi:4-hydroxysphinganine ceramide fatty acyl 2-hydroxylase
LWTLIEYILHRYLFHMKPGKRMAFKIIHFLFHGVHHKTPFDEMRIVFPPIPALILTITIHNLLKPFFYANCFNRTIITCGGVLGYLIYDLTHCYIHHGSPKNEYFYQLKRYHYNHHFVNQNIGFGVSSPFWDKIFNTEISLKKLSFRLKW